MRSKSGDAAGVRSSIAVAARNLLPALCFMTAFVGAAAAAVFGTDERIALPAAKTALAGQIGVLYEERSRSVCTAFCVADQTIATAAHCLYRTSGERPPKLDGFTFRLAADPKKLQSTIAGANNGSGGQYVLAGSLTLNIRPPIDATKDWALVRLKTPLCAKRTLPISRTPPREVERMATVGRVYQVGFHRDLPDWHLSLGPACPVKRVRDIGDWESLARDFSDPRDLILHTCDTGGASSGSPLLIDGATGPEVVGINVGTYLQSKVLMKDGAIVHRYKADTIANTAVGAPAFVDRIQSFEQAEIVGSRDKLREIQRFLEALGLYDGKPDGYYGPALKAAIETFEHGQRRPVTGLATSALLLRLAAVRAELGNDALGQDASGRPPRSLQTGTLPSLAPTQDEAAGSEEPE